MCLGMPPGLLWGGLAVLQRGPPKPFDMAQAWPIFKHVTVLCCWEHPCSYHIQFRCILVLVRLHYPSHFGDPVEAPFLVLGVLRRPCAISRNISWHFLAALAAARVVLQLTGSLVHQTRSFLHWVRCPSRCSGGHPSSGLFFLPPKMSFCSTWSTAPAQI
jgi:hypothetical protein